MDDPRFRPFAEHAHAATLLRLLTVRDIRTFCAQTLYLDTDAAKAFHERLFRGIAKPWHYEHATGWMGKALRMNRKGASFVSLAELGTAMTWLADEAVYLLCCVSAEPTVLVAPWDRWRVWLTTESLSLSANSANAVFCTDSSAWALVYWEGSGPRRAKRGKRRLLLE